MQRTPEPELMLGEEQALAYARADFAEPHDRFVALLRERLPALPQRGLALDLGCAAHRPDEVRAQLRAAGVAPLVVEVVSDRHWIAWGAPGVTPDAAARRPRPAR